MHSFFTLAGLFVLTTLASGLLFAHEGQPSHATQRLLERNEVLKQKTLDEVADNVYVASGYQVSQAGFIIGDDGLIVIDPGLVPHLADEVKVELAKITDKPVLAIIYTHGHMDHFGAASAYYREDAGIQVWARDNFMSESNRARAANLASSVRPAGTNGMDLSEAQKISVGIAIPPRVAPLGNPTNQGAQVADKNNRPALKRILPTHTFSSDREKISISGVDIELVKAPGETQDHLYVWLPKTRVLFAGDNFYRSWPNVYPLRGNARRSTRDWIESLGKMIAEQPTILVGGHTPPVTENVMEVLTNYRDALAWVHDRTIEGIKKYMTPDDIVEYAALPEKLANLDYLQDYYGSIESTVLDIYAQDMGWFDSNALSLHRETPLQQAQRMAELLGGERRLIKKAKKLSRQGDALGAARLAYHWTKLDPDSAEAFQLLSDTLAIVAEQTFNANVRNYTFSTSNRMAKKAQELSQ